MSLINYEKSILFSSDISLPGVNNKSADGSTFTVSLNNPLELPKNCISPTVEVNRAGIWNIVPNISAALKNNTIRISGLKTYSDIPTTATGYVIPLNLAPVKLIIPDGIYSITELDAHISQTLGNMNVKIDVIKLNYNKSTNKTVIQFTEPGISIDFTEIDSISSILGFDKIIIGPSTDDTYISSTYGAKFNNIEHFLIASNLVSEGIPIINMGLGILARIDITAPVGNIIIFEPINPIKVSAVDLTKGGKSSITFRLIDQLNRPVDTSGEDYSFVLTLKYQLPYVVK